MSIVYYLLSFICTLPSGPIAFFRRGYCQQQVGQGRFFQYLPVHLPFYFFPLHQAQAAVGNFNPRNVTIRKAAATRVEITGLQRKLLIRHRFILLFAQLYFLLQFGAQWRICCLAGKQQSSIQPLQMR